MQKPPRKKVACDMWRLFTFNSTQKVIQIWTPNRSSTAICSFATWAREETRNSLFFKSLKLLSPSRLSSRFTFSPRFLSCRTSYSISGDSLYIRNNENRWYNVTIEAQRQKKCHPVNFSVKNKLRQRWFGLISGINIALLYVYPFSIPRAGFSWCDAPRG